jgi:uncharacterized protein (DUF302 family)
VKKMKKTELGFTTELEGSFEEVVERTRVALKEEGFGVLTEIDVKKTLKAKLDVNFSRYLILGACNPSLAHKALSKNLSIGLLLPCNVTVYEAETGNIVVSAVDPVTLLSLADADKELQEVAQGASEKVQRALSTL